MRGNMKGMCGKKESVKRERKTSNWFNLTLMLL